jgi:hypothetical protein
MPDFKYLYRNRSHTSKLCRNGLTDLGYVVLGNSVYEWRSSLCNEHKYPGRLLAVLHNPMEAELLARNLIRAAKEQQAKEAA